MATLIKASGTIIQTYPKNGSSFTLEELQDLVGGYVEMIPIQGKLEENECPYFLVNEEGRLLSLPVNEDASEKARIVLVGDILHLNCHEWESSMV